MKKIITILSIILILIIAFQITSNAVTPVNNALIYTKKITNALLTRNGSNVLTYVGVYNDGTNEWPAYCMNRALPGLERGSQTVNIDSLVDNVMVWKAVINGYPYKSISELGCQTEDEAYLATKQAVYCILEGIDPETYSPIGEEGIRTLNALKQIVANAKNSSEVKSSSEIKINQENSLWKIDTVDNKYVSQVFNISTGGAINSYTVKLDNVEIEGLKLVDEKNNEKNEFNANEKFKILMPITNITNDGNFSINVTGKVKTKPVLYGRSTVEGMQNYAITAYAYEDGNGNKKVYYTKNDTKIIIIKKDNTENKLLEGVEFELLDSNNNVINTGLKTNSEGKIEINNLLPGIYYVKETRTLEGYSMYDKIIKVELDLNETSIVNVINNVEEPEIEVEKPISENTVQESKSEISVKLPKTGC
ncbi:MAG: Cys-Gln thioester bond-forming surface protein [Clostridia bacterium]|nr:Cys-Gln thioester bond-forming surface protein [Clostridia bacterium]